MLVVVLVIVAALRMLVIVRGLSRFRLGIVFEGVGRTQRFAFQARRGEPNKLPDRKWPDSFF
jgi:hypothetical protein